MQLSPINDTVDNCVEHIYLVNILPFLSFACLYSGTFCIQNDYWLNNNDIAYLFSNTNVTSTKLYALPSGFFLLPFGLFLNKTFNFKTGTREFPINRQLSGDVSITKDFIK